jgi:hypothetical protein
MQWYSFTLICTYSYTVNPTVSSNATIDTVNPTNTIVTSGASITVAYTTWEIILE